MASRGHALSLLACAHLAALCCAAPLSNETTTAAATVATIATVATTSVADSGLLEGSCTLGDVVYMAGDEWGGSSPCERCRCSGGAVSCARAHCEPRPGCKALHRPDQCCPIYQCECEQEGRIYGNGEKLVDPKDPCRVCYCQGGEVVCRRIACFVRDDCRPRAVPGRCCPEYDNCPLRGVTAIPGVAPTNSNVTSTHQFEDDASTVLPRDTIKQEITIKEITPVSEIPVMTDVKIKEILPSTSVEVTEFTSSKSPLIVREATSEKSPSTASNIVTKIPAIIEIQPSAHLISTAFPVHLNEHTSEIKSPTDASPTKISLSTQDFITSELYASPTPSEVTFVTPITVMASTTSATTRPPMADEDDPSIIEHNPAFPPIPDDLSVSGNHDDDTMTEQNLDGEHASDILDAGVTRQSSAIPDVTSTKESIQTSKFDILEKSKTRAGILAQTAVTEIVSVTEIPKTKESPMLNLRSAIPTEILNVPSALPADITGELDDVIDVTTSERTPSTIIARATTYYADNNSESSTTLVAPVISTNQQNVNDFTDPTLKTHHETESPLLKGMTDTITNDRTSTTFDTNGSLQRRKEIGSTIKIENSGTTQALFVSTAPTKISDFSTVGSTTATKSDDVSTESIQELQGQKASTASKQLTEITSQTEFSSLPIETSDQNPQDSISKEKNESSVTLESFVTHSGKVFEQSPEIVTVHNTTVTTENRLLDDVETTEFVLNKFGSFEAVTEDVELLKLSTDSKKNAALITQPTRRPSFLNDLNDLVGDIVSIGDSNEPLIKESTAPTLPSSEEFIPINAGYKSKNNNWNVNSISEVPPKIKSQNSGVKQKIEIEDDESHITDSSLPHDKVEPTTRRPIIDNVSSDLPENKTSSKDIEILTQSYVPTLSRKPTKVVMKKSHEQRVTDASKGAELSTKNPLDLINVESTTSTEQLVRSPSTPTRLTETTTGETATSRTLEGSTAAPTAEDAAAASTVAASTSAPSLSTTLAH